LNKTALALFIVGMLILFVLAGTAYMIGQSGQKSIRVACVGDSLTEGTEYTYQLARKLGRNYSLYNFGVGGTTVTLASHSPYMDTLAFQDVLDFKPHIVIIMLGTNDAQPILSQYSSTFVDDYITLIQAFQELPDNPDIWLVLPPPIFSNNFGHLDHEYFEQIILSGIKQVGNKTSLPVIDVYSLLLDYSDCFPDGVHPENAPGNWGNEPVAQIIATAIYNAIIKQ